jgi:hypothetical protein
MRNLIIILAIFCFGCNHSNQLKSEQLKDTIEKLRKRADYRPLNTDEAYDFINKYYLPRLDTMPTKRKIFIYALTGKNFKETFDRDKAAIEGKYSDDRGRNNKIVIEPSPPAFLDKSYIWDSKKLINTNVIADTGMLKIYEHSKHREIEEIKAWHKKFGFGYMIISYPQFNPNTKRLLIKEWIENSDWCGAGRERTLGFTKVSGGWKAD